MEKTKKSYGLSFMKWVERTFMPIISKLGENRYIDAIRNGMISIIPILLIGSLFLILFFFPIGKESGQTFGQAVLMKTEAGKKWASFLMLPYRLTYPMLGFFAVLGIARSLSKSYKLDDQQGVLIALIGYLISIIGPTYTGIGNPTISTASFGSATIFGGIVVSILSIEIFRLCVKYNIIIKMPKSVPQSVAKPFNALIPMIFVILPATFLFYFLKFNIHSYVNFILSPLQTLFGKSNYFGFLIVVLFVMILWIAGIHGMSIIGALARPFWLIAIDQNSELLTNLKVSMLYAKDGANILVEPFFQWFVWIGGAGATLGLIIVMLLFAKSKYIRSVTYPSVLPGIFNINEPIIFGYPLVLNPFLALPAILSPIVMGTVTFILMKLNLIAIPVQTVGWTLPTFFGALLSTGLDWKAGVLTFVLIFISCLIWYPFAIAYDKKLLKEEIEMEIETRIAEAKKQNITLDVDKLREEISKEFHSRTIFKRKFWKRKQ